jgi:hypothetical protein
MARLSGLPGNMEKEEPNRENLRAELQAYQDRGVSLLLEGRESSPESIASACMVAEHGSYMRDYSPDEDGKIDRIDFRFVREAE